MSATIKDGLKGNYVPLIVGLVIVICVVYSIRLMPQTASSSFVSNTTNNQMCNNGCPYKNNSDFYKLYTDYAHQRRKNDMLVHHNIVNCKGPANIFIIRHGEDLNDQYPLDCNGIMRSIYIPELIEEINGKGFGISALLTAFPNATMHKEQTIALSSWLLNIPLFMYGTTNEIKELVNELFTNKRYHGKTILICWKHECMQNLLKTIIKKGTKMRNLTNYTFKNPQGTSDLPYWPSNNYTSIYHLDKDLKFSILEQRLTTCYPKNNNIILYGKKQHCT